MAPAPPPKKMKKKPPTVPGRKPPTAWDEKHYVTVYEVAREGGTRDDCAGRIGAERGVLDKWWVRFPALADAYARGRAIFNARRGAQPNNSPNTPAGDDFFEYCYKRLPAKLARVWEEITTIDREYGNSDPVSAEEMLERLTANLGTRAMQHLFIHALIVSHFNKNEACRRIGLREYQYQKWLRYDPDFAALIETIPELRKDFLEGAFYTKVAEGDVSCILFGLRTQAADRGYGKENVVRHEHKFELEEVLAVLPLEVKVAVLGAVRQVAAGKAASSGTPPLRELTAHNTAGGD